MSKVARRKTKQKSPPPHTTTGRRLPQRSAGHATGRSPSRTPKTIDARERLLKFGRAAFIKEIISIYPSFF